MASQLRHVVDAQGVAVCWREEIVLEGNTPPKEWIQQIRDWILVNDLSSVWFTDRLNGLLLESRRLQVDSEVIKASLLEGPFEELIDSASGMLVLQIGANESEMVIFFRPQYVSEVKWGGNPEKATEDGVRLSPRKSFALWTQTVKAQSRPWSSY